MSEKEINHADREHSVYSPSSMSRIDACPLSVVLGYDLPELDTTAKAKEGTTGHEYAERAVVSLLDNGKLLDEQGIVDDDTEEFITHANNYARYIHEIISPFLSYPHYYLIEKKVQVVPGLDCAGTMDFGFVYKDENNVLHTIGVDYKYGTWVVKAEGNWQMVCYLRGLMNELPDAKFGSATAIIYQPRIDYNGKYKPSIWQTTYDELKRDYFKKMDTTLWAIEGWVKGNVEITEEDKSRFLNYGSHCKFCKAKGACAEYKKHTTQNVIDLFKNMPKNQKGKVDIDLVKKDMLISTADLAFITNNRTAIQDFADQVSTVTLHLMQNGTKIPGYKLISQKARAAWLADEATVKKGLVNLGVKNVTVTKESLITIGDVKKQLGKNCEEKLKPLLQKKDKTYKLVTEDHKDDGVEFESTLDVFKRLLNKESK